MTLSSLLGDSFARAALTETQWDDKSTPTFDFNSGIGGGAAIEGEDAHIDAGIVFSRSFHTAEYRERTILR